MKKGSFYLNGLPNDLSFKCRNCGTPILANINSCSNCKNTDPFYFGEIKKLTGGINNIVIALGITGAALFLISFLTRFSGLFFFSAIALLVAAEVFKYKNNQLWFSEREAIVNKQRTYINNFDQWKTIIEKIVTKEKEEFVSQWILKKADEKIPKLK